MASFQKRPDGQWRAQVQKQGERRSKVFPTKSEAKDWASRQEYLILNGRKPSHVTLGACLDRYAREVSVTKRGERWEVIRLEKLGRDRIAKLSMAELSPADLAGWRDRRLQEVKPASVIREMQLLAHVLEIARREWGLIQENPLRDVRRPRKPQARDRRPTERELEALGVAAGYDLENATARVYAAFMFAIETGMRRGEICGLEWARVDLARRVAHLPETKNGFARDVPLSLEAVRILQSLPKLEPVFGLRPDQVDALYRKIRSRAGVVGLNFHDSRREAVSRLSKKLDVLALAKMIGHRDIKMLQVYYQEDASEVARRLD